MTQRWRRPVASIERVSARMTRAWGSQASASRVTLVQRQASVIDPNQLATVLAFHDVDHEPIFGHTAGSPIVPKAMRFSDSCSSVSATGRCRAQFVRRGVPVRTPRLVADPLPNSAPEDTSKRDEGSASLPTLRDSRLPRTGSAGASRCRSSSSPTHFDRNRAPHTCAGPFPPCFSEAALFCAMAV